LDNLRVPLLSDGKFKILSFRSKDPVFKTDPGVIPSDEQRESAGITVVQTPFHHDDMRDTGPVDAKNSIEIMLDKFLTNADSEVTRSAPPQILDPGPVTPYVPVAPNP
jgi:hypothetical protein